ncbi:mechanosensitive ion channel family protein [Arsenicibacter rosenii]|nr:mechanosensitive ion channel family protein [Arsenicibacter rosenii]
MARHMSHLAYQILKRDIAGVPLNDFVRLMKPPMDAIILMSIIYVACHQLTIPEQWNLIPPEKFGLRMVVERLYHTLFMGMVTWLCIRAVKVVGLLFQKRAALTETKVDDQLVPFVRDLLILFVCFLGLFATLSWVYDVNVLALVTSLGIGGLALALAARETLENLFASFAIVLDRPFLVGDSVSVGGMSGDVEQIGFRSTRIRTDDGSLLTVPNRLMVSQSLDNLTERQTRRARFFLRFPYDTPPDRLKAVMTDLRNLIGQHPKTNKKTSYVRLDSFGDSGFEVLVIFFVDSPTISDFRIVKEEINFSIIDIVQRHQVQFALPSRIVHTTDTAHFEKLI